MNIIIIGCGQVGIRIASSLCRLGHDVAMLSQDDTKLDDLPADFSGLKVMGVPMDTDVLESAGIKECDALAAVTPDDNLNIVISQIAVEMYNVPRVVTRILDPAREGIFEELGLKTVCPTKLAAGALLNVILGDSNTEMVTFGSHTAKFNEKMEKRWIGRMICDIPIYENEIIYGIYNDDGNFTLANDPKRIVKETDKIIFSSLID